ncbi:MAG: DUF3857 and transglutaminase domain-containing protein [Balneola sp.]
MRFEIFIIILLSLFFSNLVTAQKSDFGDVSIEDFSSYPAKYDSSESAVVFFEVAKSFFSPQLYVEYERHIRIKVLTDEGTEWGEVSIPFNKNIDQDVFDIEAASYEVNGDKIEVTKLDEDQIFEELITNDIYVKKFVIPSLSKGSIIEYRYRKRVGSAFNLPDWEFHKSIPVLFSEYEMKIPHNYKYNTILSGVDSTFYSNSEEYISSRGGGVITVVSKKDIPPVKDIPFITTTDDFKTKIYNQLIYINHTGAIQRPFANTWEKIADEFRDNDSIGKQRLNGKMKDKVDEIISDTDSETNKIKQIFKFVSENITWNGFHRVTSNKGIRDTFKEGSGNSADINIMLIKMLEYAGIEVNPAFISTRSNGFLITNYPIIYQFNNVVAIVKTEDKVFLLDATEGYRNLGQPPVKNLYRIGLMVTDKDYMWIETAPSVSTSKNLFLEHNFTSTDTIKTKISGTIDGYFAETMRNLTEKERTLKLISNSSLNYQVDSLVISGIKNPEEALKINIQLSVPFKDIGGFNDITYLNPSFIYNEKSPLQEQERDFPMYFPYPFKERIITKFIFPEDYELKEFSKPKTVTIDNNLARFRYVTQYSGNTLTILEDFSVNKTVFSAEDYPIIKNLFDEYYEYKNRPVTLEKIPDTNIGNPE